jgi:hypothetical protein
LPATKPTLPGMDTPPRPSHSAQAARFEPSPARQHRLARDIDMIANTRAFAAAGRLVSPNKVGTLTNSLDTNDEPPTRRPEQ